MAGLRNRGRLHRTLCASGKCASGRNRRLPAQRFPPADQEGQHRRCRHRTRDEGRQSSCRAVPLPDWIQGHPPRTGWKRWNWQPAHFLKATPSSSRQGRHLPTRSITKYAHRARYLRAMQSIPDTFRRISSFSHNASTERQRRLQWDDALQHSSRRPLLEDTGSPPRRGPSRGHPFPAFFSRLPAFRPDTPRSRTSMRVI